MHIHSKLHGIQFTCLEIPKGCSDMSVFKFTEAVEVSVVNILKFLSR